MNRVIPQLSVAFAGIVLCAGPAISDGVVNLNVYHNEIAAEIEFANGVGADITIGFENAQGLSAASIGLTAELVNPNSIDLMARLPNTLVGLSSAFPLLLSIVPPEAGTLVFYGVATVSIHTHNLGYSVGSPFRLFVAEDGGPFADITDQAGSGSYRVRGSRGEFSEFMIVADLRQINDVIEGKFDRLESVLVDNLSLISGNKLYGGLSDAISASRNAYLAGDEVASIEALDDLINLARANAGGAIPNLWRARDDLVNLDGQLRAAASTLRYSLTLLANDLP